MLQIYRLTCTLMKKIVKRRNHQNHKTYLKTFVTQDAWSNVKALFRSNLDYCDIHIFFYISNSFFHLSLELLRNLPKSRLKVAKKLLSSSHKTRLSCLKSCLALQTFSILGPGNAFFEVFFVAFSLRFCR